MKITPTPGPMHASVTGVDLALPLGDAAFEEIEQALARYGALSFPGQRLQPAHFKAFTERFGSLERNVANARHEPGIPEMMILSNIVVDGAPIGMTDAGQGWHTDLSYGSPVGYVTALYGIEIPHRNGQPLGSTEFCNMHLAYDELPEDLKRTLEGLTATHDFEKFWEMMRRERASTRAALTDAQRAARPPVSHPLFVTHPVSGRRVLYADPGYTVRINELEPDQSDRILARLFAHQTQERFKYAHRWKVGDVLIWDDIGTIHNAVPDYLPTERRLLKRCQALATRFAH